MIKPFSSMLILFPVLGMAATAASNCEKSWPIFERTFQQVLLRDSSNRKTTRWHSLSSGKFDSTEGYLAFEAGNFGSLEVSQELLAGHSNGYVTTARRFGSRYDDYIVKYFLGESYKVGSTDDDVFERKSDPLVGEYVFSQVLRGIGLVPAIRWISRRLPLQPREILKMGMPLTLHAIHKLIACNSSFTRTIVEERVGLSLDVYFDSEEPSARFALNLVYLLSESIRLLSRLYAFGIVHGDGSFRNIAFASSDVSGPLVLIDLEDAVFVCDSPTHFLSEYQLKGNSVFGLPKGLRCDLSNLLGEAAIVAENKGFNKLYPHLYILADTVENPSVPVQHILDTLYNISEKLQQNQ